MSASQASPQTCYEIRYRSLLDTGRALTFPCDADGHVPMDELSRRSFVNYLYARALVGRDYAAPVVMVSDGSFAAL